jgi:hypothetical protein
VAEEVVAAQHRDRIPLVAPLNRWSKVDVLVPLDPADKPELHVDSYGWVAFVRRPPEGEEAPDPAQRRDDVTVFVAVADDSGRHAREFRQEDLENAQAVGDLDYPADTWAYPGGEVALEALALARQWGLPVLAIVALTDREERRPLAALRAALFGASMDTGYASLPVHAFGDHAGKEAIVVVLPQPQIG